MHLAVLGTEVEDQENWDDKVNGDDQRYVDEIDMESVYHLDGSESRDGFDGSGDGSDEERDVEDTRQSFGPKNWE